MKQKQKLTKAIQIRSWNRSSPNLGKKKLKLILRAILHYQLELIWTQWLEKMRTRRHNRSRRRPIHNWLDSSEGGSSFRKSWAARHPYVTGEIATTKKNPQILSAQTRRFSKFNDHLHPFFIVLFFRWANDAEQDIFCSCFCSNI